MELTLRRSWPSTNATVGVLFVDGQMECFTLEDVVREIKGAPVATWKVKGSTAIPEGRYRVVIDFSNRFGRPMPHILDVPGFDGVRIHWGNDAADTEGCPLLGDTRATDWVGESRQAFLRWFPRLDAAIAAGQECWITVRAPVDGE